MSDGSAKIGNVMGMIPLRARLARLCYLLPMIQMKAPAAGQGEAAGAKVGNSFPPNLFKSYREREKATPELKSKISPPASLAGTP